MAFAVSKPNPVFPPVMIIVFVASFILSTTPINNGTFNNFLIATLKLITKRLQNHIIIPMRRHISRSFRI